jgi:hypothetical protein
MPAKKDTAINPTTMQQVAPGKFRFGKTVNDKEAQQDMDKLHGLVKDWQQSDNLDANAFRQLTKRTMIIVLRAIIRLATRSTKGADA